MKKKLLMIGATVVALLTTPAMGDGMAVKAPPYKPTSEAAYSWTGCYIGANGGYAWNTGRSSYRDPNNTADPVNGIPAAPAFGGLLTTIPLQTNTNGSGWIGGGVVGCNWQMGPRIVLGLEGDIDAMGVKGDVSSAASSLGGFQIGPALSSNGASGTMNEQVSLRWLSTLRARVGSRVLEDRGLLFVTGGLAVGSISSSGSVDVFPTFAFPGTGITWGGSSSSTRIGPAVGGGFEYALTDHWTVKTEYLYYNLGRISHPLNLTTNTTPIQSSSLYPTLGSVSSPVGGSIVRVGLNFRLN